MAKPNLVLSVAFWAGCLAAAPAFAQAPSAPVVKPPALVTFVEAEYPAEAREQGLEAGVQVEMLIDGDGSVADAKVVAPAGHGFDQAALAAVRRFRFEPARRDGEPVAVRIRYRYVFELRPPAPPVEAPAPASEPPLPTQTPAASVASGDAEAALSVSADDVGTTEGDFGATARVREAPSGTTRRTIEGQALASTPGTRGDALRVIETMPGVAQPPFGGDALILRGASPGDSEVFFEGAQVLRLYHFGGITSFTNARLIESIDLYPGNFGVRYGRKVGGVVEVTARDPRRDRAHGVAELSVIDGSLLAEGPVGKHGAVLIAARRSFVDLFFKQMMPEGTVLAAPVYDDYQGLFTWRPTTRDRLRLFVYGSDDEMGLVFKDGADNDPAIHGDFHQRTYFHRAQAQWDHSYSDAVDHEISVTAGGVGFIFSLGEDLSQDIQGPEVFGRSEWRARLAPAVKLTGGLDVAYQRFVATYHGPAIGSAEGDPSRRDPLSTQRQDSIAGTADFVRPAAYLEASTSPVKPLTLVTGVRLDYFGDLEAWTVSPRATARWAVTRTTTVKGGVGRFSQPPDYGQAVADFGNPDLRPQTAMHYGLGVEQAVGQRLALGLEGFYKSSQDIVVMNTSHDGIDNGGRGRIHGAEASVRLAPGRHTSAFLSYTLSRSERNDHDTGWRLFDYDQTHILTAGAGLQFGKRNDWQVGSTFRLVTGNPETPVTGSVYDAGLDVYRPVYGAVNSRRSPTYRRLDVRLEKQWHPGGLLLATYVDLLNATNAENREATSYSFDYMQSTAVHGLPILPSVGVRGEL